MILLGGSFWQKDSLITHILFELCLLWYLAQSTFFLDTLYNLMSIFRWCLPNNSKRNIALKDQIVVNSSYYLNLFVQHLRSLIFRVLKFVTFIQKIILFRSRPHFCLDLKSSVDIQFFLTNSWIHNLNKWLTRFYLLNLKMFVHNQK